jgi:dipeptidyl aminopeptidase/acylaminoacyl peptidase
MGISDSIKNWTEIGKNLFAFLRDLCLFSVLVLLLCWPNWLGGRLQSAGFRSIEASGVKWEAEVKQAKQDALVAGAAVSQSKQNADATLQKLDEIVKSNPELKTVVEPLRADVAQSSQQLAAADARLVTSVGTQQDLLVKAGAETARLSGWMYLGSIDESKARWNKPNIDGAWPVTAGELRRVNDTAYVRTEGGANNRSTARPLGVAQVGQIIRIDRIEFGHLRAGGWTVWAQVTVQP